MEEMESQRGEMESQRGEMESRREGGRAYAHDMWSMSRTTTAVGGGVSFVIVVT